MAARSRATSSRARSTSSSRGERGLREAIDNVVKALPLGSLMQRLSSVESAVSRLELEARRVIGGLRGSDGRRRTAKRATAKRATAKRATAKRATAKRATAKRATGKPATTAKGATAKRATTKRATTAKGATAKRATAKRATVTRAAPAQREDRRNERNGGMTGEELARRSRELMSRLPPPPPSGAEPDVPPPDDEDLASEELSVAVNAPELPGPLP